MVLLTVQSNEMYIHWIVCILFRRQERHYYQGIGENGTKNKEETQKFMSPL